MKKIGFALFLLVSSSLAWAQEIDGSRWALSIGKEFRYEKDSESQNTVERQSLVFAADWIITRYSVGLDYSNYKNTTENGAMNIGREHRDLLFHVRFHPGEFSWGGKPYLLVVTGSNWDIISTSLYDQNDTSTSSLYFSYGAGAGLWWTAKNVLFFSLEGRILSSRNYEPNPMSSFVFRFGFIF